MIRNPKLNGAPSNHSQSDLRKPAAALADLDELVRTGGEAMPDSIRRRRRVLRGLVGHLPADYALRDDIAALLVGLELHELSCRELPQLARQSLCSPGS